MNINLDSIASLMPRASSITQGAFSIKGVSRKLGLPVQCLVRLYEKSSGQLVGQQVSAKNGAYAFYGLSNFHLFYVVAHEPATKYNAVIQDNVVAK